MIIQSLAWRYIRSVRVSTNVSAHPSQKRAGPLARVILVRSHDPNSLHVFCLLKPGVEDAPAPAALHSFKVHVTDGKIHVTADPENTIKENMMRHPRLLTEDTSFKTGLVIVGGGSGAFYAVESLREVCDAYRFLDICTHFCGH